jgi:Ser-tRNA(Ala) deacylase AlaX
VLVFGAIQRFFPDFFPSCFTEQRQNLLSLYESTEYTEVKIDEGWQDKLSRAASAFAFLLTKIYRSLATKLKGQFRGEKDSEEDVNGKDNREDVKR